LARDEAKHPNMPRTVLYNHNNKNDLAQIVNIAERKKRIYRVKCMIAGTWSMLSAVLMTVPGK
jgi:hypothetical protein